MAACLGETGDVDEGGSDPGRNLLDGTDVSDGRSAAGIFLPLMRCTSD